MELWGFEVRVCTVMICLSTSGAFAGRYNPTTGHTYDLVETSGTFTWSQARDLAAASVFNGVSGHLVTITSREENDFLLANFTLSGYGAWMGGSDAAQEGVWKWVVGPEAGTTFWMGGSNGTPYGFTYWGGGEPSDGKPSGGSEDYLIFRAQTFMWNDLEPSRWPVTAYLVEWEVAPEPATLMLLVLGGLAVTGRRSVWRNRTCGRFCSQR